MGVELKLTDNSGLYLNSLQSQIEAALEAVGQQTETHAKQNLTAAGNRNTGDLVNSIAHEVRISEETSPLFLYIFTNRNILKSGFPRSARQPHVHAIQLICRY